MHIRAPCSTHDLYDVYARMTRDVNLSTFFCFLCKLKIDDDDAVEVEEEEEEKRREESIASSLTPFAL